MLSPAHKPVLSSSMNGNMTNITAGNISDKITTPQGLSVAAQVGLAALYIFGIIIGTTGNILVVVAVAANRSMRTGTNFFIVSLSIADLLVTTICMPPFFAYNVITWPIWPFGRTSCQLLSYLVHTSVMASALSLLSISYDRFVSVYFPLRQLRKPKQAVVIVSVIWIVSPFLFLPSAFHHDVFSQKQNGQVFVTCKESWPTEEELRSYLSYRVSFYFLFVIQISVVYALVGYRLFKRQKPGIPSDNDKTRALLHKKKVIKMLLLVIACFSLSWLPYTINKLFNITPPSPNFKAPDMFVFVGNMLGLLNSCVNPILYAVLNKNFRIAFKNALRCKCNSDVEERRRMVNTASVISRFEGTLKQTEKQFRWHRRQDCLENQNEEKSYNANARRKSFDDLSFETCSDPPESPKRLPTQQVNLKKSESLQSLTNNQVPNELEIERRTLDTVEKNKMLEGTSGILASLRTRWNRKVASVESLDVENGKVSLGLNTIEEHYC